MSPGVPRCREAYMDAHADELCDECKRRAEINPLRAFDCKNPDCAAVMADAPKITEHLCDDCREHYDTVKAYLAARAFPSRRIRSWCAAWTTTRARCSKCR